jgi:hypothetical protein
LKKSFIVLLCPYGVSKVEEEDAAYKYPSTKSKIPLVLVNKSIYSGVSLKFP